MTEKILFSSRLDVDGFGEKVVTVYANGCYEVNTRE